MATRYGSISSSPINDEEVGLPEGGSKPERTRFSCRKFLLFIGPGFLMSIAYLDPGNIESDLRSGAVAGFHLLWVLLLAHLFGLMLQRLSARLAAVAGMDVGDIARIYYPKYPRIIIWLLIEAAIISADMQEVIGTAIALNLLTNGALPLWAGVLITIVDTMTFLLLDRYGLRKLEVLFGLLIAIMGAMFGIEYIFSMPNQPNVLEGVFVPSLPSADKEVLLQAIAIMGAVIMPHNLFLHSSLITRQNSVDRSKRKTISEANTYNFLESAIALGCSFVINLFVVSVFAQGLYGRSNADVLELCEARHESRGDIFQNNTDPVSVDIFSGGVYLGCQFGAAALYIWAVGVLAAGQSSTMAGCYAGQFVMEGFLKLKWPRWRRVLFSRSIAIVPTVLVATFKNIRDMTGLNDSLNALQMFLLPFALIPVLTFASSEAVMKDFRMNIVGRIIYGVLSIATIGVNLFCVFEFLTDYTGRSSYALVGVCIAMLVYAVLIAYLGYYCLIAMGCRKLMLESMKPYFPVETGATEIDAPWLGKISDFDSVDEENRAIDESGEQAALKR